MQGTSIVIHELTRDDGTLHVLRLVRENDSLVLRGVRSVKREDTPSSRGGVGGEAPDEGDDQALPLPDGAIDAVMRRFGKPLEGELPRIEETLDLGGGRKLVRFRFLSRFDVIARDYL